jgi:hypothetical protein
MNRRRLIVAATALAGVVAISFGTRGGRHEQAANDLAGQEMAPATAPAAGLITHIDPVTGKAVDAPADPGAAPEALGDAVSTSSEGLVRKPSPVPGGGQMVELDGRFMNAAVATADSAGAVGCVPADSAAQPEHPAAGAGR